MSIIVTGACGFIGRHLVASLVARGHDPLCVDVSRCAGKGRYLRADLGNEGVLDGHLGPGDVIYHLAGQTSVGRSVANPVKDFRANVPPLLHVLEAARSAEATVVFASSAAVFDAAETLPLAETARQQPSSPYGAAKSAAEAYCGAYHRAYALDARIARLFSAYGEGMRGFAIRDFYDRLREDAHALTIHGDGRQVRDYVHVDDVVEALQLVAEKGQPGEDYNIASGCPVVIRDLAAMVAESMGITGVSIVADGQRTSGVIHQSYADISKLRMLGYRPRVSLIEGLRRTLAWLECSRT